MSLAISWPTAFAYGARARLEYTRKLYIHTCIVVTARHDCAMQRNNKRCDAIVWPFGKAISEIDASAFYQNHSSFFCAHKIAFLFSAKFDRIFWRTPVTVVMVDMRDMHASTENITKKKNDKLVDTQRTAQHITADGRLHGAQRNTEREREKAINSWHFIFFLIT